MSVLTLACDPGECLGIAWGVDDRLVACDASTPSGVLVVPACINGQTFVAPSRALFELPKYYGAKAYGHPAKATAIANSLIRESVTLGEWKRQARALGFECEEFFPRDWKGQVKKRTMCKRVIARLTRDERRMVSATLKQMKLAPSKTHNVLDAIGMFFWKVGRL